MHSKDELCYSYLVLGCIVWESARKKRKALKECLKRTTIHCSISSNSYYYNNFPRHYRLTTLLKANYFFFQFSWFYHKPQTCKGCYCLTFTCWN